MFIAEAKIFVGMPYEVVTKMCEATVSPVIPLLRLPEDVAHSPALWLYNLEMLDSFLNVGRYTQNARVC